MSEGGVGTEIQVNAPEVSTTTPTTEPGLLDRVKQFESTTQQAGSTTEKTQIKIKTPGQILKEQMGDPTTKRLTLEEAIVKPAGKPPLYHKRNLGAKSERAVPKSQIRDEYRQPPPTRIDTTTNIRPYIEAKSEKTA